MVKKSTHSSCPLRPRFGVVAAQFHGAIAESLEKACLDEFSRRGVCMCEVQVVHVPGAFEIPVAALKLAAQKNIQCVICLGAVVRGQTRHYELVAEGAARGIMEVSLKTGKPVIFEVLAADTLKLCEDRAKVGDRDNKGAAAARVAVEMVQVLKKI